MRLNFTRWVAGISLGLIAATGHAQNAGDRLLNAMRQAGSAQVSIATAPPYAFLGANGEPQGYMIDVSKAVLTSLGISKVAASVTTWDAMVPGLQARQVDFVPAGLAITAPRCQAVLFSAPVTVQQDALFVLPGNPKQLTSFARIGEMPDIRLAVLSGSAQEAFALKQGVKADQLVRVPDVQAGIATVIGGRAHAFGVGQFTVPNPQQKGVDVVVDNGAPLAGLAVAFRKEDVQARDAFNKQLQVLRANGTLKELYAGKYGFTNWDVLARVTKTTDIVPNCE